MKVNSFSRFLLTILSAQLAVSVALVTPSRAAEVVVYSLETQQGVVRALMSTGGAEETKGPFQGFIVDTGREEFAINNDLRTAVKAGQVVNAQIDSGEVVSVAVDEIATAKQATTNVVQDRRLLVVPIQWPGKPFSNLRMDTLNSTLSLLSDWWTKVSAGIETLNRKVLPVQNLDGVLTCDDPNMFQNIAFSIAKREKLEKWYTNISVVLPENNPCPWGGLGEMPGTFTWISGVNVTTFAHELGHNLGFAHANTCVATTTVSLMQPCTQMEYGDPTNVMGRGGESFGFNAASLKQVGWLEDSKIQSWTGGDQTYVIATLLDSSAPVRAIHIPQAPAAGNREPGEYWLQMNQASRRGTPTGVYLNLLPSEGHAATMSTLNGEPGLDVFSWLCDITAGQNTNTNFAFIVGRQWNDPTGRFSINVLTVTETTATIRIWSSSTLPIGAQAISVAHEALESGQLTGGLVVNWSAVPPVTATETEPLQWIASTAEGQSCVASVGERLCVIHGAARNKLLDVIVVGKNYAGLSVPKTSVVSPLPFTIPFVRIKAIADESFVVIQLEQLDDGGMPLLSLTTEIGKKTCTMVAFSCRVNQLTPNTEYTVVVVAKNSIGERRFEIKFKTIEDPVLRDQFESQVLFGSKKSGRNSYTIWWIIFGKFGRGTKVNVVVPRINGRPCVRTSHTSCEYRNLVLKKSKRLVIHVYKKGPRSTFHGTKTKILRR